MNLEIKCDNCKGFGREDYIFKTNIDLYSRTFSRDCLRCNGRGKIPTNEAEELLEFLKFHLEDYFEKLIQENKE